MGFHLLCSFLVELLVPFKKRFGFSSRKFSQSFSRQINIEALTEGLTVIIVSHYIVRRTPFVGLILRVSSRCSRLFYRCRTEK